MKAYAGVEVYLHSFLTLPPDGGECSASCPGSFTIGERASGGRCTGRWVGTRASLDAEKRKKTVAPAENWTKIAEAPIP